jgi:quercetin dioxygenase-like cupin family protein
MKSTRAIFLVVTLFASTAPSVAGQSNGQQHVYVTPSTLQWGPAPDSLPPGAQAAVIDGDPTRAGMFVIRLKFPSGYTVPPHWHPTDENVVVLQGTMRIGMGDKVDEKTALQLPVGSFIKLPKEMHHYATATGESIVQVHGMGPFAITYVNKADDPRAKGSTTPR